MSDWQMAGPQHPARVKALFERIARRYDLMNDLQSLGLHRRWKRWLVTLAQPQRGDRALDVCCGTGDIAFELARRGAAVVGLDFSGAMLRAAQARMARVENTSRPGNPQCEAAGPGAPVPSAASNVWFVQADALRLPFPDRSFEIVTIGYGLRNLADRRAGLTELWRVLRPGGRLVVLEFGKPVRPIWCRVYFAYLRWVVPWLGRVIAGHGPAYRYILESVETYPGQQAVATELSRLPAVEAVRMWELLGGAMSLHWARKRP